MNGRVRVAGTAIAAALLLTGVAGCGGDSLEKKGSDDSPSASASAGGTATTDSAAKGTLVVGSAGFTESTVLAELYAKVLSDAGYTTSVQTLANRELYEPALEKGQIDVVPEYAATFAEWLNTKVNGAAKAKDNPVASADVNSTVANLTKLATPRGLKVLSVGQAVDQNAFAVTKDFAAQHHLKTLSDLGASKAKIKLAAGDECPDRPYCSPGLKSTYGIDITGIDPKGVGTPQSKQAVKDGTDQLVLTTTTDATLDQYNLVLLKDDKGLQSADNLLPVVNTDEAGDPAVADALNKLTAVLTTADLTSLNEKVDGERQKPADVAADYLKSKGLSK